MLIDITVPLIIWHCNIVDCITLQHCVTLLYVLFRFLTGLREKLATVYPQSFSGNISQVEHLVHIHYHGHNFIVEYTPLMFAYVVLCFYLYFSVRKYVPKLEGLLWLIFCCYI